MIDRETIIESSIETFVKHELFVVRGYPQNGRRGLVFLDAYPDDQRMSKPLDSNYIAVAWSTDDGGRSAELGSPLRVRRYTFDFHTFGISRVFGKNIASVIRFAAESNGVINLIDPVSGVTLDAVDVDFASVQPVITSTPRPWEHNVWVTRLRVEDWYDSSGGG